MGAVCKRRKVVKVLLRRELKQCCGYGDSGNPRYLHPPRVGTDSGSLLLKILFFLKVEELCWGPSFVPRNMASVACRVSNFTVFPTLFEEATAFAIAIILLCRGVGVPAFPIMWSCSAAGATYVGTSDGRTKHRREHTSEYPTAVVLSSRCQGFSLDSFVTLDCDGLIVTIQRVVRHSVHSLQNLMIRMIGSLALIPGRLPYVHMCHPRVSTCSLLPSSIFRWSSLS